jgi:hypothetical protein
MAEVVVVFGDWTEVDVQVLAIVIGGTHQAEHLAFRLIKGVEGLLVQTAPLNADSLGAAYRATHTLPPAPYTTLAGHGYTSKRSFPL